MKKIITFNDVYLAQTATVVGKLESDGPIGGSFDIFSEDEYFGKNSFEKGETEMCRLCINTLLAKSGLIASDIDVALGGDLVNQCVATSYAAKMFDMPYLGLYGACSTIAEALLISSCLISGKSVSNALAFASSHFCTAERQYRFPLEYGAQRTPTSQNTVTGCGAYLLTNKKSDIRIKEGLIGTIIDNGITDQNNMGAAMATAAVDSIRSYFAQSEYNSDDFDAIVTGDLGQQGNAIAVEMLMRRGLNLRENMYDCGMMIYDLKAQDVHSGGSGCGCLAVVGAARFVKQMLWGSMTRVMFVGTGALLNQNSVLQGNTIPGIAHVVVLERT